MRSDEIGSMRRDLHIDSCRWQSWPGFKSDVFFFLRDGYRPVGKKLGLMLVGNILATRIIVSNAKKISKLTKRLGSR